MTIVHPRRLREARGLPQALQAALRELPNAPPEPAQLDELRLLLGLSSGASQRPLRVPERRLKERRLRRTVVALLFFPVAAAAAVGTVIELQRPSASSAAVARPTAASGPSRAERPLAPASAPPAIVPTVAATIEPGELALPTPADSAASRARLARSAKTSSPANGQPEPDLRAVELQGAATTELELLQRANAALKGQPAQALALAFEHRQLFPAGNLGQEREVIAIKALVALGDSARARESLARFESVYPRSAHAGKLREIVR
jgi:hypothetical protein